MKRSNNGRSEEDKNKCKRNVDIYVSKLNFHLIIIVCAFCFCFFFCKRSVYSSSSGFFFFILRYDLIIFLASYLILSRVSLSFCVLINRLFSYTFPLPFVRLTVSQPTESLLLTLGNQRKVKQKLILMEKEQTIKKKLLLFFSVGKSIKPLGRVSLFDRGSAFCCFYLHIIKHWLKGKSERKKRFHFFFAFLRQHKQNVIKSSKTKKTLISSFERTSAIIVNSFINTLREKWFMFCFSFFFFFLLCH